MYSEIGEWYPEGVADISPVDDLTLAKEVQDAIRQLPLNRKSRRLAIAKTLKHGRVRPDTQAYMVEYAREFSLEEVVKRYPMRDGDARVLAHGARWRSIADRLSRVPFSPEATSRRA
jgi:hypothetical protein